MTKNTKAVKAVKSTKTNKASIKIKKKPLTEKQALRRKMQIEAKIAKLNVQLDKVLSSKA